MPLVVAVAAILNTFTLVWALTYITDVSIIVQFLIALVGLGVAIDYALLMIFRFRDELREGNDVESALVETMTHAGHRSSLGTTVARVCCVASLPPPVAALDGHRRHVDSRRLGAGEPDSATRDAVRARDTNQQVRVMPRRLIDHGHPEDGAWGGWARFVIRRPVAVAAVGLVLVVAARGARQLS